MRAGIGFPGRRRRRGRWIYVLSLMLTAAGLVAWPTSRAVASDPLFADDFESGGLSRWSSVSGLVAQQQEVLGGAWAARGTTSGPGVYASATLAAPQAELYYRCWVKLIGLGGSSSVNFMKFRTAAGTAIAELFVTPAGLLGYRNDVTAVSSNSQVVVSRGAWHEAQMHVLVNGTASTVEVWLDGSRIGALSSTAASLGGTPVGASSWARTWPGATTTSPTTK